LSLKNSLRHFATLSRTCYRGGGQKCEILDRFLATVAFDALWSRNGAIHQQAKTFTWSIDDWYLFCYFANPSPNFYRGQIFGNLA